MRTALLVVLLGTCHSVAGRLGIINGDDAEENEYPFMVRLLYLGKHHYCGASLIRPNVVLTATHCVQMELDGKLYEVDNLIVVVEDYSDSTTGKANIGIVKGCNVAINQYSMCKYCNIQILQYTNIAI